MSFVPRICVDGPNRCKGDCYDCNPGVKVDIADIRKRYNELLLEASLSPCGVHRRYKAIRKPRVACEACWRLYIQKNP